MPSAEDYAPDGGNAPLDAKKMVEEYPGAKPSSGVPGEGKMTEEEAQKALDSINKESRHQKNSAMVLPRVRTQAPLEELVRPLGQYITEEEHLDDPRRIPPTGPWTAIALENGEWISGELVGRVEDTITLRRIHDV